MHLYVHIRFSGGIISHARPYVKICTTAPVAILEGLTGILVVRDRGELKHDHATVASEDIITNQLSLSSLTCSLPHAPVCLLL